MHNFENGNLYRFLDTTMEGYLHSDKECFEFIGLVKQNEIVFILENKKI